MAQIGDMGPGGRGQVAEKPPSTQMSWPVTYALAGLARKTATPSKSAASPLRPIMVRAASSAVRGVATKPGATALQHTPWGAQASDWDLVSETRPPLAAP